MFIKQSFNNKLTMAMSVKLILRGTLLNAMLGSMLLSGALVYAQTPLSQAETTDVSSATSSVNTLTITAPSPQEQQLSPPVTSQTIVTETTATETTQPPTPVAPFYQNGNSAPKIGSGSHLFTVTLGLMVIVGLIFALSWFVKRFTQGAFAGNAHIKMLAALPLGTRERLVLVETGGQQLLIGVTANAINTLHVLETPIVIVDKADLTSEFSKKLIAIMQQKTSAESSAAKNSNNVAG